MTQRKFRTGDQVSITAIVARHFDHTDDEILANRVTINIDGHHSTVFMNPNQLTLVRPHFGSGDRVRKVGRGHKHITGEVLAMDGDDAWVRFDHGGRGTIPALELELDPAHVAAA